MQKTKKAIKDLETYLGKDETGKRLLAAVDRAANETRKECRIAKEAAEKDSKQVGMLRNRLHQLEGKQQELENKLRCSNDKINSLEMEVQRLRRQLQPKAPEVLTESSYSSISGVFDQLRKDMKACPFCEAKNAFRLSALVTSLRADQMIKLGRFVTCYIHALGYVSIFADEKEGMRLKGMDQKNSSEFRERVAIWLRNAVDIREDSEKAADMSINASKG